MAPPSRTSLGRRKSWPWHGLLLAGSIWSCHCFASLWEDLFSSPGQWADFRADKACGKKKKQFPDFKREGDGKALWIDSEETPPWVEEKLNEEGNLWKPPISSSKDHLWQDLIDSPHGWQDFRTNKPSPRFPDFKRTEDGMSLWFDSYDTPDWAATKLMDIEDKLATSTKEHLWQDLIDSPHEWQDFRTNKPSPRFPDFKRIEDGIALWFDAYDTPDWAATKLMDIEDKLTNGQKLSPTSSSSPPASSTKEHLWQDLIDSPHEWQDFRTNKPSPRFPDFKRIEDGISLWFDSYDTPDWAATKLMDIEDKLTSGQKLSPTSSSSPPASSTKEHLWQDLIDSPHEWQDFRTNKPSPRFPDFKRIEDGMSLWFDSYDTPDWVATKLMDIEDKLTSGQRLFPDFRRTEDGKGLWLESKFGSAPEWVHSKLEEVGDLWDTPAGSQLPRDSTEPFQSPDFPPKLTDPIEIERLWEELLGRNEMGWLDCREAKKFGSFHPGHPDFIKNHTGEGLWCDDTAPEWAVEKLKELDAETVTQAQNA
eukprot:s910_g7.t1